MSKHPLDDFTVAYITAALWTSTDDEGWPLYDTYDRSAIAPPTIARMVQDCLNFQEENAADIAQYKHPARAGHDFWLTRNHHGAGFWCRDLGDVGERLTDAAHSYGEFTLTVDDNGEIYGG